MDGAGTAIVAGITAAASPRLRSGRWHWSVRVQNQCRWKRSGVLHGSAGSHINHVRRHDHRGGYGWQRLPYWLHDYPNFPTTPGTLLTDFSGGNNPEGFAMKLNPAGTTVWSTFLPGHTDANTPGGAAVNLDNAGNVWLTGTQDPTSGLYADYVIEFIADGSFLNTMVQLPLAEAGQDIAVDPSWHRAFCWTARLGFDVHTRSNRCTARSEHRERGFGAILGNRRWRRNHLHLWFRFGAPNSRRRDASKRRLPHNARRSAGLSGWRADSSTVRLSIADQC